MTPNPPSGRRWPAMALVLTGAFMATLDASIINLALPTLVEHFRSGLPTVQWVVSAYLLAVCSLLPLSGRLGDTWGRRATYVGGFVVFTAGSALCGAAGSLGLLVGARVIQAAGAAMLMAAGPALIMITFPGAERARAFGYIGSAVSLGALAGPSLGGLLLEAFGWRSIFYVNLPVGVLGVALALRVLPVDAQRRNEGFDIPGAALFALGMVGCILGLSHGQEWGWASAPTLAALLGGAAALACFVRHEKRVEHPVIDLAIFRIHDFLYGNLAGLLDFTAVFVNVILMPFYLAGILKLPPAAMGLLLTPFPLMLAVFAPVAGHLGEKRVRPEVLATVGLTILMLGLLHQATLGAGSAAWRAALGQGVMGLGQALFLPANAASMLMSVPLRHAGVAGGILALVRNLGMVCGVALGVSIFENRYHAALAGQAAVDGIAGYMRHAPEFLGAFHAALLAAAALALAAIACSLRRGSWKPGGAQAPREPGNRADR